jgi:signal transduction histidine kinase
VAEIVRAIKEFSHPGPLEKTPLNINRAIESTVLVSRNEWKYVADLHTELTEGLPPVVCVAGEFNQVILNLIVNAAHAIADVVAAKPGEKGEIVVSTHRDGEWAEIRVRDTGTGIPKDAHPSIFNPFFTTKVVGKGTGQGLAIAHSVIVQKHGGTISFDTETGVGTTFKIRLPIAGTPEQHTMRRAGDSPTAASPQVPAST